MKSLVISGLLLGALSTQAQNLSSKADEITFVKTIIPSGKELAGAYLTIYDVKTSSTSIQVMKGDDYVTGVKGSYLFADLNKDSIIDLAVVVEDAPKNDFEFGARTLMIYLGTETGNYRLETSSSKVVLTAQDGGAFGDPLQPLSTNPRGSLVVSHYGGSVDRWATKQIFQFRQGNFKLVGQWLDTMNTGTMIGKTVDTNLITGDRITTKYQEGTKNPDQVTKTKIPVQTLQRLDQAELKFE